MIGVYKKGKKYYDYFGISGKVLLMFLNTTPKEYTMLATEGRIILSDEIIPAEVGEFYNYTSEFTTERPVFALMKCKANKNRPVEQLPELGAEANIFFCFDGTTQVRACSIRTAHSLGLLDCQVNGESFDKTLLGSTKVDIEDFHDIRSNKDVKTLMEVCQRTCNNSEAIIELGKGSIVAMMNDRGKYGMFLVQEMTPESVQIMACHTLL